MARNAVITSVFFLVLVACGSMPSNFEMYPQAITEDKVVDEHTAILLVGNAGPGSLDYLQFVHSLLPAINVRNINVPPNSIIAVPVPVGITNLELQNYTVTGRGAGYLPNGMAIGYVPVHTPRIDIAAHGAYYIATIFPAAQQNFTTSPDPGMLKQFKTTHPKIASLRANNFSWPR
jgi:hypothetical protein